MSLLSLPNELLLQISEDLSIKDLSRLLLTCRFFNILLASLLHNLVASPFFTLPNAIIIRIARHLVPTQPKPHPYRDLSRLRRTSPFLIRLLDPLVCELVSSIICGKPAIIWAVAMKRESLVKILLDRGTGINAVDSAGNTALHHAIQKDNKRIVKLLLETEKFNINPVNIKLETPLHYASSKGVNPSLLQLLLEAGIDANAKTLRMLTALHIAAGSSNFKACEILLEWGADINARSRFGRTPLIAAGNAKIAKLLCEKGADVDAQDRFGMTALYHGAGSFSGSRKMEVLLQNGANTEIGGGIFNDKPLQIAAAYGRERNVKLLLESGANVDARYANGLTPLSRAAGTKSPGIVRLLLEKGASPNLRGRFGGSPLTEAKRLRSSKIAIGLIEKKMSKLARQRKLKFDEERREIEKDIALKSKKNRGVKEDKIQRGIRISTSSRNMLPWWPLRSPKAVDRGTNTEPRL